MALNFQPQRDPGQEIRSRWAQSLDGIFEQYQLSKQNKRLDNADAIAAEQRVGAERDRVGNSLLTHGVDSRQVTPQAMEAPEAVPGLKAFIERKKQAAAMASQGQQVDLDLKRSQIRENDAQAGKFGAEAGLAGAARGTKAEGDLRGELQNLSKPFVLVRDSMGRIEAAAKNPTAAGDLALIFNYMKVLDPGSTVREGEFATAQNSAGVPERLKAKYNQVISGERLADDQRLDFVSRARDLYQSQAAIQKQQEEQYRGLAGRMGAKPENVILNQALPPATKPYVGSPDAGTAIALTGAKAARLAELRAKAGR